VPCNEVCVWWHCFEHTGKHAYTLYVNDIKTVQWTRLCVAAATALLSVSFIYNVCSGCVMQFGTLLVAKTFVCTINRFCVDWIALFTDFNRLWLRFRNVCALSKRTMISEVCVALCFKKRKFFDGLRLHHNLYLFTYLRPYSYEVTSDLSICRKSSTK
jgi:hypothetical protein